MGRNSITDVTATRWIFLNASAGAATIAATSTAGIMPMAGTFSNLRAYSRVAPGGAASWVVTLDVNGVLKTSTCTITSAITSCSDLVNTVATNAGDLVSVKFATGGSPTGTYLYFTIQFTPTTANQTAWFPTNNSGNGLSATGETYSVLSTSRTSGNGGVAEVNNTVIMPEGGTFSNLWAATNLTPSPGTYALTVKNQSAGATTTITCTLSTTAACSDTVNTYATSSPAAGVVGDLVDLAAQPASSPTSRNLGGGIVFTPTVAGNFNYTTFYPADSATQEQYIILMGNNTNATMSSTVQASSTMYADAMTISDLQVKLLTAPGAGKTRVFAIMVNAATSTATCTVNGSSTPNNACRWSGTLAVATGDQLSIADFPTGGAATSEARIAIVASIPAAAAATLDSGDGMILQGGASMIINSGASVIFP